MTLPLFPSWKQHCSPSFGQIQVANFKLSQRPSPIAYTYIHIDKEILRIVTQRHVDNFTACSYIRPFLIKTTIIIIILRQKALQNATVKLLHRSHVGPVKKHENTFYDGVCGGRFKHITLFQCLVLTIATRGGKKRGEDSSFPVYMKKLSAPVGLAAGGACWPVPNTLKF